MRKFRKEHLLKLLKGKSDQLDTSGINFLLCRLNSPSYSTTALHCINYIADNRIDFQEEPFSTAILVFNKYIEDMLELDFLIWALDRSTTRSKRKNLIIEVRRAWNDKDPTEANYFAIAKELRFKMTGNEGLLEVPVSPTAVYADPLTMIGPAIFIKNNAN